MKYQTNGGVTTSKTLDMRLAGKERTANMKDRPDIAPEVRSDGKNGFHCSRGGQCAVEEKVVVFVGCTQNGKSSLIRSILRYGGYNEEAAAVEVGIGNSSTTKEVSSYKVAIDIRRHVLKDADSNIICSVDADTELYDLKPESCASQPNQHIHLLMIDTPGLDDSDNAIENSQEGNSNDEKMRTVDEKHKLAVLQALSRVEKIHAACFVLSIENTLGNSTQALTREYLSIFQQSNLYSSFHFAHTFVNVDNMFHDKAVNRPAFIENTFGLRAGQATHHHINNVALKDDPIDVHFANFAFARLLESLANEPGQPTTNLRYPKSQAYKSMDYDLVQSINVFQYSLQRKLTPIEAHIASLEISRKPPADAKQVQHKKWSNLRHKVSSLDNEDLVDIGYDYKSDAKGNVLQFDLTTKTPIRDWTLKSSPKTTWDGPQDNLKGTRTCTAALTNTIGFGIWGSIQLWGWKKEVFESKVNILQKEKSQAWVDYKKTEEQVNSLDSEIAKATLGAVILQDEIRELQEEKLYLQLDYIPVQKIKVNASYFANPNTLCYSHGHGLIRTISTELLPCTNISVTTLAKKYEKKVLELSDLVELCTMTLRGIHADKAHKLEIKSDLLRLIAKTEEEIKQIWATIQDQWNPSWQTTITMLPEQDRPEAAAPLKQLLAELEPRIRDSYASVSTDLLEQSKFLEERLKSLEPSLERINAAIEQNNEKLVKWEELHDKYTALRESMVVLVNILKSPSLAVGVFTLLRRGIEECGEDSEEPWQRLYDALKEIYLCDPEGFMDIKWYG